MVDVYFLITTAVMLASIASLSLSLSTLLSILILFNTLGFFPQLTIMVTVIKKEDDASLVD